MSAPLWVHGAALAIVLLIGLTITVPGYAYFSDEGAAIIQEQQLRAGDGWIYEYAFAAEDPTGELRPFVNSQTTDDGRVAPYAKHPLFVGVLAIADGAFGVTGLVLVAVAGSVFAALAAGLIGRRIDSRLAVPALWVTGLASPIFFDAYLVLGHTIAAATAGFAVLLALSILERKAPPRWMFVMLAITTATTVLLRSEGLVLLPGLVVGGVLVAWREPEKRTRAIQMAIVAGVAGVVAFLGERAYIASIVGNVTELSRIQTDNWLVGRFRGLYRTWFPATYSYETTVDRLTALVPLIGALAAIRTRRTMTGGPLVVGFVAIAVLFLLRFTMAEAGTIPGLVVAFPIGWAGLWLLRGRYFTTTSMRFVGVVGLVMVTAVLLTQYSKGGGVEWGGRYFALTLPIITPVLLRPYLEIRWDTSLARRALPAAATLLTIILIAIAIQTLRDTHNLHRSAGVQVEVAMAESPPPDGTTGVVVITERLGPQILWRTFRSYDWLAPFPHDLDSAERALEEAGRVQAVVVDSKDIGAPEWANWMVVDTRYVQEKFPVHSMVRR
jgi:hypothetical protein